MDGKRKRPSRETFNSQANSTSLQVKKQRIQHAVIDLTSSSPEPEEIVRASRVFLPKRVDSGAMVFGYGQIAGLPRQSQTGQTQHTAIDLSSSDQFAPKTYRPPPPPPPPKRNTKTKYYAVARGNNPGVYVDWPTAEAQVKGYSGAVHQSFRTHEQAEAFVNAHEQPQVSRNPALSVPASTGIYLSQRHGAPVARISSQPATSLPQTVGRTFLASDEESRRKHIDPVRGQAGLTPLASASVTGFLSQPSAHTLAHEPPRRMLQEAMVEPQLCKEQQDLVLTIMSKRNVFYTGSAGCGKSTVLKAFVKELKEMGKNVVIVAPTGKAALEINGSTYFTFAGWTPDHFKKPIEKLRAGAHQKFVNKRMNAVDVLIIDEISMMENHAFERLNEVMKEARRSDEAFGGVQLVVTGDFCQLPPVKPFKFCMDCGRETSEKMGGTVFNCSKHGDFLEIDKWAFRSRAWRQCNFAHINLTKIHRQKDRKFIDILERCRMGKQLTDKESSLLLNHKSDVDKAVRLFSTREEVRRLNYEEYVKLKTEPRKYNCYDDIQVQDAHPQLKWKVSRLPDGSLAALREQKFDARAELKEGMRVVLQVNLNIDQGLVNGSQGIVIGWEAYDEAALPKADKTRGQRGENVPPPINAIMGEHAVYRERHVKAFIQKAQVKEWPIVEFENGIKRTIFAECIVSELGDTEPYTLMSRTQIPLLAGWAMTVHKSQGMTLTKVEVDLGKAFEEGQMYVALSRARSLDGLKVRSLGRWNGGGNAEVMQFLNDKFGIGG